MTDTGLLARVEVNARRPDFEFTVRYDERIKTTVKWVNSASHRLGLRIGDRMTTVDGKPLTDFALEEFLAAVIHKLEAGESQTLQFEGRRFLCRRATITLTYSYTTELIEGSSEPKKEAGCVACISPNKIEIEAKAIE